MTYPQQQPGGWSDPSWPAQQPTGYPDPNYPVSGQPVPEAQPVPGYPAYGYPVAAAPQNNGMAIASMVVSIVGLVGLCGYGLGGYIGIVGAILGHVSKRQIRERGEAGGGMATAGIVMGWIATGIAVIATVLIVIFVVWAANADPSDFDTY
ncbi:MAG TPA: DUF4190 domain-containing protein [Micromonospora sp.]